MLTYFSPDHQRRNPATELNAGQLLTPYEAPIRVDMIIEQLRRSEIGAIQEARAYDLGVAKQVHDPAYLDFLASCWGQWQTAGHEGEIISYIWPGRRMPSQRVPSAIAGKVGYYSLSADTSISGGTWEAVLSSQSVALAATDTVLAGAPSSFALCRPPGHHAARDQYGGYCFLNNAAIAAQHILNSGQARVAILDIDFHHGNGTQDIFYDRSDVLFASLHGDPMDAFPHFLGFADELGQGSGTGYTLNYPLARGTDYPTWANALDDALDKIADFGASHLVVSLGVDAYEDDPISFFKLKQGDFVDCGQRIGRLGLDTVFIMEGGYAVADIGTNVTNVLQGYEATRSTA